MEEAAELISSIRIYDRTGNAENMREELGDILLQVVMHAQIAKEEGLFTLEDVIDGIGAKMVRRHPHVFGGERTEGEDGNQPDWEEIKRREKEGKDWILSPLREIPPELPALTRAAKVMKRADRLYGTGRTYDGTVRNLEKAVERLKEAKPSEQDCRLGEIMGQILMDLSYIAGRFGVSQEQLLTDRTEDLIEACEPMEKP